MATQAVEERRNGRRVTIARPAVWAACVALGAVLGLSLTAPLGAADVALAIGVAEQGGWDGGWSTMADALAPTPSAVAIDGGHVAGAGDADESATRSTSAPLAAASAAPTPTVSPSALPAVVASERAGVAVADGLRHYGLNADVGFSGLLPDLGLLLALRPARWLYVQAGGGYNATAFGVRGGLTVRNPFLIPVSLTCEGGHYFAGDANRIVHWFSANARDVASLRRFSYDYLNVLGGVDFAGDHFALYVRGGVTWMRTTIADFAQSVHDFSRVDLQASDPRVNYRGPTFKLGMYYFF